MGIISYRGRYKIKTHIRGLDNILHGGIVYHGVDFGAKEEAKDGVLISINGARGMNKTDFAVHMCHGITRSLFRMQGIEPEEKYQSKFYSVNKTDKLLQRMHENAVVSRLIEKGIQDYIVDKHKGNVKSSLLYHVVKTFFKEKATVHDVVQGDKTTSFADRYENKDEEICDLLARGPVSFNVHSSTLNFRHLKINTGLNRIRKFSGIQNVHAEHKLIKECIQPIFFNGIDKDKTTKFISRLEEILDFLVELYDNSEKGKKKIPCLVVDGLSQLTHDELHTIPIDYLQRILRKVAYVSILVFDERGKDICRDSDMIFELNRNTDKDVSSFSYNTLEIQKCLIQKFSSGKHLYKLLETGMCVFPSLEHTLNYSTLKTNKLSDLNRGMFNISYSSYLKRFRRHLFNNALVNENNDCYDITNNTIESNLTTYDNYVNDNNLYRAQYINYINGQSSLTLGDNPCEKLLNNILFRNEMHLYGKNDFDTGNMITSIVGPKNSFKRTLSNAVIFNSLHSKTIKEECDNATKDVLYISFNNDRQQLLKTVTCPCLNENKCENCIACYDRIRLYSIPFGDISASEMIYTIDKIIETYNIPGSRHVIGQILIDELNSSVVKNAHPFIYQDKLLIPALFKLLREKQIPTIIICDDSKPEHRDICDFSDNVIHTKRRQVSSEPYKEVLDLFITKDYRYCNPRKLYGCSLKISDYPNLIVHDGDTFTLKKEAVVNDREVSPLEIDTLE